MGKASLIYTKIGGIYSSLGQKGLAGLFANLSEAHQKLYHSYDDTRDSFKQNFLSFFRFYQHELDSMEEFMIYQKSAKDQLMAFEQKLWKKKEARFEQKNVATWELDPACNLSVDILLKNKTLAFQEMCAKETKEAAKMHVIYGYFTNKAVEEFGRVAKKDLWEMMPHFADACGKCAQKAESVFGNPQRDS